MKSNPALRLLLIVVLVQSSFVSLAQKNKVSKTHPNIIYIYAYDLGYGDVSCYGADKINTPNIDALASSGIRFVNAHSASATCTPSRFALMTGQYPWRVKGTGILPGDAALIIPQDKITLPRLLKNAGYTTGIVGKWHLGLGEQIDKNWNQQISPGPNEIGFDYSFIFPATADRVPTVFLENQKVLAFDSLDPIEVSYSKPVGKDPTGKEHPELLKMKSSPGQGHDQTIVNGIGRIGYMSGGHKARWVDEEVSLTFLEKARQFISGNIATNSKDVVAPFFLYFALTEPHVPRMPATTFKGKSLLGYRGDAILQLDWTVGEIMREVKSAGIEKNTIIIFTSDNGPVLDDGYVDDAVVKLNGHKPSGPFRGGKYSVFEGGTRVPFIVSWNGMIKPGMSDALICQMDLLASLSQLTRQSLPDGETTDSENVLEALLGKSEKGRSALVEDAQTLAIVQGDWKYILPGDGPPYMKLTNTETGNSPLPQLYNLKNDPGEKYNVAPNYPEKVLELADLLSVIRKK